MEDEAMELKDIPFIDLMEWTARRALPEPRKTKK